MKISLDYKLLHLRFLFGIGFVWFVVNKAINRNDKEAEKKLKPLGKQIKKVLKEYKKNYGAFNLAEIEAKDGARIKIRA